MTRVHEVENGTRREFILGGASLGLLLAGCGGDDGSRPAERRTRTVQDAYGDVVIPTRPQRVVADTVTLMANAVALGAPVAGAAVSVDIRPDYAGPAARRVKNVVASDGWTIDVEKALALRPDLIIAVGDDYNEKYCRRYKQIAPTYCVAYPEGYTYKDTLKTMADVLGRETEAAKLLTRHDDRIAELRGRVAAAGLAEHPVAVVRFDAGGWFGIRVGQEGNQMLKAIGLREPRWPKSVAPGDYIELSTERLDTLNRAHTLFVCRDDNVVEGKLEVLKSPLWKGLEPVREGRALRVGGWNGEDVLQLDTILDDIERTFVGPAEAS